MKENRSIEISIIIPVYNAEKFLSNCLDSIINQSYSDFEIIIVDDGSTDRSRDIYLKYSELDSRIKILQQENKGVSIARNIGIKESKGEFLVFIDSDDIIKNDMLMIMFEEITKKNADIAFCGFEVKGSKSRLNDTQNLIETCRGESPKVISNNEAIIRTISTNPNKILYGYIWRNMYRADIIKKNNITFSEKIKISEDFMFILEVLNRCKKVVIIPKNLYVYNVNDTSVTAKYMPTVHSDMMNINNWMLNNICNDYTDTLEGYNCCVANTYLIFVQNICRNGSPYSLKERVLITYKIKKKYKYNYTIDEVWRKRAEFRSKAWIAMVLFKFNLEWLYIILFTLKEKNTN